MLKCLIIDENYLAQASHKIIFELRVAVADLLEDNDFCLKNVGNNELSGKISSDGERIILDFADDGILQISVKPLKSIIKDYFLICSSYDEVVQGHDRNRLETIDMARRGVHNEAAEMLGELLADKVQMSFETSRRLFTLICAMHLK